MNANFVDLSRNRALLRLSLCLMLLCFSLTLTRPVSAAPSGLTYLGQLLVGGVPANGSYDFQFQLFNAATGGTQVGPTVTVTSVPVAQGLYFASIYFGGNVFTGPTLWLQTSYRVHPSSGNPAYTTQTPRNVAPNSAFADYAQLSGSTAALQSYPISTTAPTTGQVLQWNGSLWTPTTQSGGGGGSYTAGTGLTLSGSQFSVATGGITSSLLANGSVTGSKLALPLTASVSSSSDLFTLTNTGSGRAIVGNSSSNTAVKGVGYNGVYGQGTNYGVQASGTNYGVYSTSPAVGVYGNGTGTSGVGVYGSGTGTNGIGIYGSTTSTSGIGVYGTNTGSNGTGVYASGLSFGLYGSGGTYGVYGGGTSYGVYGYNSTNSAYGVLGGPDLDGQANGAIGEAETTASNGILGIDRAQNGYAVFGIGDSTQSENYAGYFRGNVYVSGTLSKAGGSFKIDDPIDPAHKFLSHSFVESPDMKNIYDGTVTLGADGTALVTMPDWFEALNQDFRYQLTAIGAPGPNLYIAKEIDGNQFAIAGGQPGAKVSWQVTGTRHDAWANAHRIPVEEDKPTDEQGLYLNPKEFGLPESLSLLHKYPGTSALPVPPPGGAAGAPKPPTQGAQQ